MNLGTATEHVSERVLEARVQLRRMLVGQCSHLLFINITLASTSLSFGALFLESLQQAVRTEERRTGASNAILVQPQQGEGAEKLYG